MNFEFSKGLKIIFIAGGLIIVLIACSFTFFSLWAKKKVVAYLQEHTEFNVHIESVSIGLHTAEMSWLELTPKLDKEKYQQVNGHQQDWVVSKIEHLKFYGIDWYEVMFNKKAEVDKLTLIHPHFYIYRDNTLPDSNIYKALPATLLQSVPFPFSIKSVVFWQGKVEYEKKEENSGPHAKIVFTNLRATLSPITSDSLFAVANPVMDVTIQADLLDSIKIKLESKIKLLSSNDEFTFKGSVQSFNASILNEFVTPLSNVHIKSGYINSIHFSMNADENIAIGKLDMDYHDLKVNILSEETPGKKSGLKTLLANLFMRDEDKDVKQQKDSIGEIRFERRKDRFIFNYWWNAVRSGILSTVSKIPVDTDTVPK